MIHINATVVTVSHLIYDATARETVTISVMRLDVRQDILVENTVLKRTSNAIIISAFLLLTDVMEQTIAVTALTKKLACVVRFSIYYFQKLY